MQLDCVDCSQLTGALFRPLFDQELSAERLESLVVQAHGLPAGEVQHRQQRDLFCLDWQKDGVWYTAGLQKAALLFVNVRFDAGPVRAGDVIACLGTPHSYQAWYESYLGVGASSVHVALVFLEQMVIAYASQYFQSASEQPPAVDETLPVGLISIFGTRWREDERVLAKGEPWPGSWQDLRVETHLHRGDPIHSDRDQSKDALPVAAAGEVLSQIDEAFADTARPADDALLHPDARDDSDIQALIGVEHWRRLPEDSVEGEYSALAFLGPEGFRHFLPAYMSWVLRHPESGAAVVGSTIMALTPSTDESLRAFTLSKYDLLDSAQRAAIVSFLRVMANFEDVSLALDHWLPRGEQ